MRQRPKLLSLSRPSDDRRWSYVAVNRKKGHARADREPRKREAWMDEWILDRSRDEGGAEGRTQKMPEFFILGEKPREREEVWSGWEGAGQALQFGLDLRM